MAGKTKARAKSQTNKQRAAAARPPLVAEVSTREVHVFSARLRELRLRNNWTLEHASKLTGVPVATLSRIENSKVSPTLDVVMRVAKGFHMSPSDVLLPASRAPAEHVVSVTKKGTGRFAELPNLIYHPLHATRRGDMTTLMVTLFAKRPEEYGPLTSHVGEEFLYVLDGAVEVMFEGGKSYTLTEGDSMYFHSHIRHGYISKGKSQAKFLIVTTSPDGSFDFGGELPRVVDQR